MSTARPLPACGAVTLLWQNHLRKTRKAPRGQGLTDTQLLFISHHTELCRNDFCLFPIVNYILDNRRNKRYFYNHKTKTRTGDGSPVDMSNHIQ